ncbi:lactonase family protein [Mycetocola manganoxydans]|uniref:Lactonase family protein n=1 Tax=Mycetocola manganoxydans TaxID=699879 RepID=A0A3L6ZY06_9MICO|nr:beta-propeller fold lactonase family protein [Mycetocola manganoxydans]RLP72906.1 lactonase family protein [Mycetocola manganoxydans]GHD45040.1 3-carboxymuconate cyclase [Mycetocola manganoxydans]
MAQLDVPHPLFWLGSYTEDAGGSGAGITALRQEERGTLHPLSSSALDSPSFVATHPTLPVVYAALEPSGTVEALARRGEFGLVPLGRPIEAGESVCQLTVAPDGSALIASCYGDGRVVVFALAANGSFAADGVVADASHDPYGNPLAAQAASDEPVDFGDDPFAELALAKAISDAAVDRQSRAHASLVLPEGRIATTDLGHDTVRIWARVGSRLLPSQEIVLPFGVGPRHLVAHPSGHVHLVTEYSNEVFTLGRSDDGKWRVVASVLATADSIEDGDNASEISLAASRDSLHVSIRGSNRVATLAISGDGSTLRAVGDVESGGNWPRHHVESGEYLHVANERSGHVSSFRLDARGVPSKQIGAVEAGSPTCLVRARL